MTNNSSGLQQFVDDSYPSVDALDKYAATFKEQYQSSAGSLPEHSRILHVV